MACTKFVDCCIGYAIKAWLLCIIAICFIAPSRACGQDFKLDHINLAHTSCQVIANDTFTAFAVKQTVAYTDGSPYWGKFVAVTREYHSAFKECRAFFVKIRLAEIDHNISVVEQKMADDIADRKAAQEKVAKK